MRQASTLKNTDWNLSVTENPDGSVSMSADRIAIILLQEIRDELQKLNGLLHCQNTLKIPRELSGLRRDVKALTKALLEQER